jgi:hypothetical protein
MAEDKFPHTLGFSNEHKKTMTRAAALLDAEDWKVAIGVGMSLAESYAEQYVKGNTEIIFCKPEFEQLYENNKKFFEALCQEGVVEWLTPLVLGKSTLSSIELTAQ